MSDHPQEIVALAQGIGVAVQIGPSTLAKENEEAVCGLIAGFINPLIARERMSALKAMQEDLLKRYNNCLVEASMERFIKDQEANDADD